MIRGLPRFPGPPFGRSALAVLVGFLLVSPARPDEKEADWWVHNIVTPLGHGPEGIGTLKRYLDDRKRDAIAPYPKLVLKLCRATLDHLPAAPGDQWGVLTEFAAGLADAAHALAPSEITLEATGRAHLAHGRATGNAKNYGLAAKALLELRSKHKQESSYLEFLVEALYGAGRMEEAIALAEEGAKRFPKSAGFPRYLLFGRFVRARKRFAAEPEMGAAELRTLVETSRDLARLDEFVAREFNDVVTLLRRRKTDVRYVMRRLEWKDEGLACEYPIAIWSPERDIEDRSRTTGLRGRHASVALQRVQDGQPRSAAREGLKELQRSLKDPNVLVRPRRANLNPRIKKTWYFEIAGLDERAAYQRVRCWYLKVHPWTYRLVVRSTTAGADPECEAVLASFVRTR